MSGRSLSLAVASMLIANGCTCANVTGRVLSDLMICATSASGLAAHHPNCVGLTGLLLISDLVIS